MKKIISLFQRNDELMTVPELAVYLGRSIYAIRARIKTFGLRPVAKRQSPPSRKPHNLYAIEAVRVAVRRPGRPRRIEPPHPSICVEGLTAREVAAMLDVRLQTARARLRASGIQAMGRRGGVNVYPSDAVARCRLSRRRYRRVPRYEPTAETMARIDDVLGIVGPGRLHELIGY